MNRILARAIASRKAEHRFRTPIRRSGIDFESNDYLGLGRTPLDLGEVSYTSNASSRLIHGYSQAIEDLEQWLASHYQADQAIYFPSGYMANVALFGMLHELGVHILYDEYIHASIRSALRGGRGKAWSFAHNDIDHLEALLRRCDEEVVVVTEGVFSMNGSSPDLLSITKLRDRYNFTLIVDEAHSTGILGENGLGLAKASGCLGNVDVRIHTFGKALGAEGAIITGSTLLKEALHNFARPLIYTTAPSDIHAKWIRAAHHRLQNTPESVQRLQKRIAQWNEVMGHGIAHPQSAIRFLVASNAQAAVKLEEELETLGYLVKAIRTPTVPIGSEGLRVSLHAHNSEDELRGLMSELERSDYLTSAND